MIKKQKIIILLSIILLSGYSLSVYSPGTDIKLNINTKNKHKIENQKLKSTNNINKKQIIKEEIKHIKTPEKVKSIYYTSYSAGRKSKIDELINIVKTTEINSVIIDIKTVSGYISFDINDDYFNKIKPISNNKIKNIKELIKKLHENNIYTIARIVVFKDKYLSEKRPDLALKRKDNNKVWSDYKGKKYLDPYSKEVWDYNINIASEAYNIGFDEINFDYVRFPSDGYISNISYKFSNDIIKNNPKYGRIIIIDKFSHYLTSKLKERYPKIILSADVFGLVTKYDMLSIGQSLESFLLYFDYVGPMVYPSHYGKGYLGFESPDNHPYEIIKEALKHSNNKIEKLNLDIKQANASGSLLKINGGFSPEVNIRSLGNISKRKIRPWLQGFSCTRCKNYISYNRNIFRKQIDAVEDSNLDSWFVWNSASNYYIDWYNKN